jgi:histidine triad (HIT) family protein
MPDTANDCVFCDIVAGRRPATIVARGPSTVAFRDVNPQAPTHVLIVPRQHHADAASLAEAAPEVMGELVTVAHRCATQDGVAAEGYRLVLNTGRDAQQTVFHVHLHLIAGRKMTWPPG